MTPAKAGAGGHDDEARLQQERDLYLRLLQVGQQENVEPFLTEALRLIVDLVRAERGYIALGRPGDDLTKEHRWSLAYCCSEHQVADIRERISHSIIAESIRTGRTIQTPSALLDPEFGKNQSVRLNRIEAVLCVPMGRPLCAGVVYLQGHVGGGAFPDEAQRLAELFATHVAPLADRVVTRTATDDARDHTRVLRSELSVEGLVGRSEALAAVLQEIKVVAPKHINVLVTGDAGTGKTTVARAIHDNSARVRAGRFVRLHCADVDDARFRAEMFGVEGPVHREASGRPGLVEAAHGGTLFLDEVAELSPASQVSLLEFIRNPRFRPHGSADLSAADVRIICATTVDLEKAIRDGRFREDLYHRLVGMPMRLPSLSERAEDLPLLVEHFCRRACEAHQIRPLAPSANAHRAVEVVEWRGNVQQLATAIERAVIRADADGAPRVEPWHVFPDRENRREPDATAPSFQDATRDFQRRYLERLLQETGWNVTETARRANLARTYLHKLINVYGLQRPDN